LEKQLVHPKTNHRVKNREAVLSCPCFHHQRIKMEAIHLDLLCPCLEGPHRPTSSHCNEIEIYHNLTSTIHN
jgi:hypothetical protein